LNYHCIASAEGKAVYSDTAVYIVWPQFGQRLIEMMCSYSSRLAHVCGANVHFICYCLSFD